MLPLTASSQAIERLLTSNLIEFLDLGCGAGASYEYVRRHTDMRVGLSLDLSTDKIVQCRKVNDLAFAFDVARLPTAPRSVSSAFCMHFLEHVEDGATVFQIIEGALVACRDFLVVRQPYFDHDEALAALGCKTYWSDWSGHRTRLTRAMIDKLSVQLKTKRILDEVSIYGIDRIDHTSHSSILPLRAPPDQHDYDPAKHGAKPRTAIGGDCFREILAIFRRDTISRYGLRRIERVIETVEPRATLLAGAVGKLPKVALMAV